MSSVNKKHLSGNEKQKNEEKIKKKYRNCQK